METAIALGIVAFSLVTLLGLIPTGLEAHRQAMNLSIGARISQTIAAEIRRGEMLPVDGFRYFDLDGLEVDSLNHPDAIFTVNVVRMGGYELPASAQGHLRDLDRFVVEVVINPARRALTRDAAGRVLPLDGLQLRNYAIHVAQ